MSVIALTWIVTGATHQMSDVNVYINRELRVLKNQESCNLVVIEQVCLVFSPLLENLGVGFDFSIFVISDTAAPGEAGVCGLSVCDAPPQPPP